MRAYVCLCFLSVYVYVVVCMPRGKLNFIHWFSFVLFVCYLLMNFLEKQKRKKPKMLRICFVNDISKNILWQAWKVNFSIACIIFRTRTSSFRIVQSHCHKTFAIAIDFNVYANGHAIYVSICEWWSHLLVNTYMHTNECTHTIAYRMVFAQHRAGFILQKKNFTKTFSRDLPTDRKLTSYSLFEAALRWKQPYAVYSVKYFERVVCVCVLYIFFSLYIHSFPVLLFI